MSRTDWETPDEFIRFVSNNLNVQFEFDVCATPQNAKCDDFYTPEDDALAKAWPRFKPCWMNPPYGRGIDQWLKKAFQESLHGSQIIALVPNSTETDWFQDWVLGAADVVYFVRGRVQFEGGESSPPFQGSVLVQYTGRGYPVPSVRTINWRDSDLRQQRRDRT